tara:strand:+ start:2015 stop:5242 length:3228 start_codon:yes stop_codon:yes gene_type:complete
MSKRSASELNAIAKRFKKMNPIEHALERSDMYVGNTRPERVECWSLNGKKFEPTVTFFSPALGKIFDEILVNAFDNIQRKGSYTRNIKISYDKATGAVTVWNDGRTIPVEMHTQHKMYVGTLVFGHIHTGENYDDKKQRLGGGRNGWGAKLTNIFSKTFSVECHDSKSGQCFKQTWTDNMGTTTGPNITKTQRKTDCTKVTFIPDYDRFKMKTMNRAFVKFITKRTYEAAACSPKDVKVYLNDVQVPIHNLGDYAAMYGDSSPTYIKINRRWEIAVLPVNKDDTPPIPTFVNGICTSRGGNHVQHASQPLMKYLAELATKRVKGIKVRPRDVSSFAHVFVSALIVNPAFDSQTKETLKTPVSEFGSKCEWKDTKLKKFKNSEILTKVEEWALTKAGKQLSKKVGSKRKLHIPKLYDANKAGSKDSASCTCIFTEGDSALTMALSGMSIVGRNTFGAFPLKGKLLNVRDASPKTLLENKEIQNICKIIGLVPHQPPVNTRYGHILIMADQDHDGSHIKGLLINFIDHFWPTLLQQKDFIQIFRTPVVKAKWRGNNVRQYYSIPEFEQAKQNKDFPDNATIKYYKGLGTSTPAEAKEYFRNIHQHRSSIAYTGPQDRDALDMAFRKTRANDRRKWLTSIDPRAGLINPTTYKEFVDLELILFSNADNDRSIASVLDGLKTSHRKCLWAAFKRKLNKEIRVAQFAGYISEHAAYHHGEASLTGTITGMAQNFVGSNNINLFHPEGQFGSRMLGGKDASSPRYIHTHLSKITRYIYKEVDDLLVPQQNEQGQDIEPQFYMPVIPMLLVNGSVGIGTGYATNIPQYHPIQIIDKLLGLRTDIQPYYHKFNGTIREEEDKVITTGKYTRVSSNKIRITELPVGTWTTPYNSWLHTRDWVSDVIDHSTDEVVDITVRVSGNLPVDEAALIKKFKLESTKHVKLVAFNSQNKLHTYKNVDEIITEWTACRLEVYRQRRLAIIQLCADKFSKAENKYKFINMIIRGIIKVHGQTRQSLLDQCVRVGLKTPEDLIALPTYMQTSDELAKLKQEMDGWEAKRMAMERETEHTLFKRDLGELKSKLM